MPEKASILVVDDELSIVEVLKALLKREGYTVKTAADGAEALTILKQQPFDLMISDIRMRPMDGIALLQQARQVQGHLAVIMMTAYATVETAVEAMKNGAFDYICKPFKIDELLLTVQRALSYEHALAENESLKETLRTSKFHFNLMIGDSDPMQKVYDMIEKIARTDSTVLIYGESGTGKELVAKALHTTSKRSSMAFVAINCAALPENLLESELFGYLKGAFTGAIKDKKGLFESADGGTLFLDEIGSLPLSMQSKLLRVLQEREVMPIGGTKSIPVDVRIIAATNNRLDAKVKTAEFREDLYYRLSVIPIELPPLRERPTDIPQLVSHSLAQFNEREKKQVVIDKQAMRTLQAYAWPGNVRELENVISRAGALCENNTINLIDLPTEVQAASAAAEKTTESPSQFRGSSLKAFLRAKERDYIQFILNKCGGNKEKAAEMLGISLATFYRKYEDLNN